MLDEMLRKEQLNTSSVQSIFLDLYQQNNVDIGDITILAGTRGIHIVPPKWCTPKRMDTLDCSDCSNNEPATTEISKLACLPLFLAAITLLVYHDTGSAITLHSTSYREQQPHQVQKMITKVGTRKVNFRGIMGRPTMRTADVYKWELGWKQHQLDVQIISVEIPDSMINIRGYVGGQGHYLCTVLGALL